MMGLAGIGDGLLRLARPDLAASALLQVFGLALPALTRLVVEQFLPGHGAGLLGLMGGGTATATSARS